MMHARSSTRIRSAAWAMLLSATAMMSAPASAQPVIQELPDTGAAQRLASSLRVLASNDTDVLALVSAGEAALDLDDADAAYGFFARARVVSVRNPQVEVGLGRTLVRLERADEALGYFTNARALGADERRFAADRGLAHDVRGDFTAAQADYRLALSTGWDDEVVRRLGLSQAIGGDSRSALQTLEPLIARGDAASWRARAFVLAMDGDLQGARGVATVRMSPGMAGLFDRFFARLPTMNPAERARAVHFGDMPAEGTRYASARPGGTQVAVATNTQPPPRAQVRTESRARGGALIPRGEPFRSRRQAERGASPDQRTRVGRTVRPDSRRVAAVAPRPAARPTLAPAPAPAPVPVPAPAPPPPPVPPAFVAQLPQPVVNDSFGSAAVASPSGDPDSSVPLASAPLAERPGNGIVTTVDPDAVQPGDIVFRPDGSVAGSGGDTAAMLSPSTDLVAVRVDERPGNLLPAGALPIPASPDPAPLVVAATQVAATPNPAPLGAVRPTPAPALKPSVIPKPVASASPKAVPVKRPAVIKPLPAPAPKGTATTKPPAKPPVKAADARAVVKPAEAKAAVKGKAKETKLAPVAERYWFQVATGGDAKALAADLKRLRAKHKILAPLTGVTSPFGKSRRLVVGPFDSMKDAKLFESKATGDGLDGYVWVSPEGFDVEPLPIK